MSKVYTVGIVGGGISGSVCALELAKYGIDNILLEKGESIVNGPPFCHLHAGGNLYPDISVDQCKTLMLQSIEMLRLFPHSIDQRPTWISVPKSEKYEPEFIEDRLNSLVKYYKKLIAEDPDNEVLGNPDQYYKAYSKEEIEALAKQPGVKQPTTFDEWVSNAVKLIDYQSLKTPIFLVQEFGWNLFRTAAQAQLALEKTESCCIKTDTEVTNIIDVRNRNLDYNWAICTKGSVYNVKYLVNSCGFRTGFIDALLNQHAEHSIEYKAAYIAKWQPVEGLIPELIFHGERGTAHGMLQITPYCEDYYQIHGMTQDITLFENGVIHSKNKESAEEFDEDIKQKIDRAWPEEEINTRTKNAIAFAARYVPTFKSANVGALPMHGAQQLHGNDLSLRVGELSFPGKFYARSEIIKASSALTVARKIVANLENEKIIAQIRTKTKHNSLLEEISKNDIEERARELAIKRGYPGTLSQLVIDRT
ncbi:MAG: FAD-dependent oxidoreductase [Bacteroidales bacterium]|nr:FAD-dependent oxidoreductase [Bacteroidales bacterium]